jgi:hypothetical protein
MDEFPCLVEWPTDATAGDLMAEYLRPKHRCTLPADHVHDVLELRREEAGLMPYPAPHRCHCGSWIPVRDVPALDGEQ